MPVQSAYHKMLGLRGYLKLKTNYGVRGHLINPESTIEVNADTVYVRSNILWDETGEFPCWMYDEIQYSKNEYIELLSNDQILIKKDIDELKRIKII